MSDQVQEIKQKADIVAIIGERVKLSRAGRNFKALCPFHSEKTPSFNVSPELGIYKCFGCSEAGDVFSFLEKFEGMTFPEALAYVAGRVGIKLERRQLTKEDRARARALEILSLAAEFYHYVLTEHRVGEEARMYLKQRRIWPTTMKEFELGYAPDSWEALYKYLVGKKGYEPAEVERVGLLVRGTRSTKGTKSTGWGGFYDRFRDRIMFPLTNQRGQVLGFAGRILEAEAKEAKYVNTPETPYYHKGELLYGLSVTKRAVSSADQVVVVEGELDALSSFQAKVKNVVAIKGSALTEEQLELISRYTRNLVLALDADKAGEEAVKRAITTSDRMGLNVRVALIKGGKDPDEIAQNKPKRWRSLVEKAVSIYDFYLQSALKRWDATSGEGKRLISRELAPILARISNQVEQAHYMGKLAMALGVTEEVVAREVARVGVGQTSEREEKPQQQEPVEGVLLDEYILSLLLKHGKEAYSRVGEIEPSWLVSPAVRRVVEILSKEESRRFWQKKQFQVGAFVESLPHELREVVQRVWMAQWHEDEELSAREFDRTIQELERRFWRQKLHDLSQAIEVLEQRAELTAQEEKKFNLLQEEFVETSRNLAKLG